MSLSADKLIRFGTGSSNLLKLLNKNEIRAGNGILVGRGFHLSFGDFAQSSLGSQTRKRFYKKVSTVQSNKDFEIVLDNKKLKTPAGSIFRVSSEPLALAVANEWDAQEEKILVSSMHITSLVNTILDNPNKLLKQDIISHILTYLENDTLLCREEGNLEWSSEQTKKWDPLVEWFNKRYGVTVEPSSAITGPNLPIHARQALQKYLHSHDFWTLNGLVFAVESVKSLILALACVDRHLSVEEGVRLAALETEFQTRQWGRVEWAHDMDNFNIQARFAASILFVHLTSSSSSIEDKYKK
ncbi:ATP synthase mitochondrial F1 complex assembly factor 2 [Daphnia magna]|uniref:ATP synthase mitochondrial F1 complex assembly factor 2 n=1 Tax=Daphnia magna TaxID=35525 RepID=UPI0006E97F39|nr:ATP synthase mitochondrial F1 complex assembly factor 2 [Daphnia magna]